MNEKTSTSIILTKKHINKKNKKWPDFRNSLCYLHSNKIFQISAEIKVEKLTFFQNSDEIQHLETNLFP